MTWNTLENSWIDLKVAKIVGGKPRCYRENFWKSLPVRNSWNVMVLFGLDDLTRLFGGRKKYNWLRKTAVSRAPEMKTCPGVFLADCRGCQQWGLVPHRLGFSHHALDLAGFICGVLHCTCEPCPPSIDVVSVLREVWVRRSLGFGLHLNPPFPDLDQEL